MLLGHVPGTPSPVRAQMQRGNGIFHDDDENGVEW